jgi:hypothetical protein
VSINKIFSAAAIAVAAAAVGAGLYFSGSPGEQRLLRLDDARLDGLRMLAGAIDAYWNASGRLPATLAEVLDAQRLQRLPADPATAAPYAYEPLDSDRYRLCATFDRPSSELEATGFWRHEAGLQCFTISPRPSPR